MRFRNGKWISVRLGISLYGIDSTSQHKMDLRVSTLKSTIAQIKTSRLVKLQYWPQRVATRDSRIATVRIGMPMVTRAARAMVSKMWVNGRLAPVIGTYLYGYDHDRHYRYSSYKGKATRWERCWQATICPNRWLIGHKPFPYEMLTGVSHRVKRIYYENGTLKNGTYRTLKTVFRWS